MRKRYKVGEHVVYTADPPAHCPYALKGKVAVIASIWPDPENPPRLNLVFEDGARWQTDYRQVSPAQGSPQ